jgi:methylmalonyl-CoA carboxyltransferase large subunit
MTEGQTKDAVNELESLKSALAAILNRISSLEAAIQPPAAAAPAAAAPQPAPEPEPEEISDEVMLALSAAVAAFLGERAHIRAVRLARSGAWAQQGRVFIQASHRINVQHHQNRYR